MAPDKSKLSDPATSRYQLIPGISLELLRPWKAGNLPISMVNQSDLGVHFSKFYQASPAPFFCAIKIFFLQ
jgi:hypothetical protein